VTFEARATARRGEKMSVNKDEFSKREISITLTGEQ
jgi:hypothetical protein